MIIINMLIRRFSYKIVVYAWGITITSQMYTPIHNSKSKNANSALLGPEHGLRICSGWIGLVSNE